MIFLGSIIGLLIYKIADKKPKSELFYKDNKLNSNKTYDSNYNNNIVKRSNKRSNFDENKSLWETIKMYKKFIIFCILFVGYGVFYSIPIFNINNQYLRLSVWVLTFTAFFALMAYFNYYFNVHEILLTWLCFICFCVFAIVFFESGLFSITIWTYIADSVIIVLLLILNLFVKKSKVKKQDIKSNNFVTYVI